MRPHFHVGIAVANLERSMAELGAALDTQWTEILERAVGEWPLRVAFAIDGPPFIELVEGPPGSPWHAANGAGVHHLAWWVDDRDAERARLGAGGLTPELDGSSIGARFDYYLAPESGLRIELVDAAGRNAFYETWGLPNPESR